MGRVQPYAADRVEVLRERIDAWTGRALASGSVGMDGDEFQRGKGGWDEVIFPYLRPVFVFGPWL